MEFKNIKALNSKDMDNNFSTLLPDFKCTSEIEDLNEMIGQKRAVKAVEFGLNMQHPGYNIFVSGLPGTGKITYIKNAVNLRAQSMEIPSDWIYVHNFTSCYCLGTGARKSICPGYGRTLR